MPEGGIKQSQIEEKINSIKNSLKPGDTFIFYSASHGVTDIIGIEKNIKSPGDEYLCLGKNYPKSFFSQIDFISRAINDEDTLNDNELTSMLRGMEASIKKWVIIDACHSGGFWKGDIDELKNIGFISSANEENDSHFFDVEKIAKKYMEEGLEYFTDTAGIRALENPGLMAMSVMISEALSKDKNGNFNASGLKTVTFNNWQITSKTISFKEEYFKYMEVFSKADMGDPVESIDELWNPYSAKSLDFQGALGSPVPLPGAVVLLGAGLGRLAIYRRRN